MSQKKRKAADEESGRPSKKQQTSKTVKVRYLAGADIAKPVIATTPGTVVPSTLKFASYTRKNGAGSESPDLLLHSSDHETIDYTVVDSYTTNKNEQHLKHYVAVFDPAVGKLNVTEARKMTVKSKVRQLHQDTGYESERDHVPPPVYSSRAALTEAFGSKKSKKAVATMTENRLLAGGADQDDPLSKALMSTVPDDFAEIADGVDSTRTTKPLPPPNPEASNVREAYPLSTLIHPQPTIATLSSMPIAHWQHKMAKQKPVNSKFRFVANRVIHMGNLIVRHPSDKDFIENLHILKYIEILLEIHKYLGSISVKRISPPDKWPAKTIQDQVPSHVVKGIVNFFFPDLQKSDFNLTRLRTHILALTLRIPPGLAVTAGPGILATEPTDIYMDLSLDIAKGTPLFRELGCKVENAKEAEMERWGMKKLLKANNDGKKLPPKIKFAKMTLPLDFPKLSQGRALKARR